MNHQKPERIVTERLCLGPISEAYRQAVTELLMAPEVGKTYMVPQFQAPEEAQNLVSAILRLSQADKRFVYGIFREGTLVGILNDVDTTQTTMELGYALHPRHWNQGYATEALTAAIETLHNLGYATVKTGAFPENGASIRVMEKAGMTRLGETEDVEYRGEIKHCVLFEKKSCHP